MLRLAAAEGRGRRPRAAGVEGCAAKLRTRRTVYPSHVERRRLRAARHACRRRRPRSRITRESRAVMKRHLRLVALMAIALAACKNDSLDLAPDLGQLRVVHAVPTLGPLTLTFDDTVLGDFDFNDIRGTNRPGDGNHDVTLD